MLRKILFLCVLMCSIFILNGCGSGASEEPKLSAEDVLKRFVDSGLPIGRVDTYTDENDPEHLLNRPGHYIGKCAWEDTRYQATTPEGKAAEDVMYKELGVSGLAGGFIEVFETKEALQAREGLLRAAYENNPAIHQYIYVHKNIIIRVNQQVTPKHAEEYQKALTSL